MAKRNQCVHKKVKRIKMKLKLSSFLPERDNKNKIKNKKKTKKILQFCS